MAPTVESDARNPPWHQEISGPGGWAGPDWSRAGQGRLFHNQNLAGLGGGGLAELLEKIVPTAPSPSGPEEAEPDEDAQIALDYSE